MKILKQNLAGETTWQYDGEVVERGENFIKVEAFFNRDDMPFQEIVLKRNDRFIETYYLDRWYNIFEIYDRDDGRFKGWYCNLTRPAAISDDAVAYVDLALDLWVNADGAQKVLDEDEFDTLHLDETTKRNVLDGLRDLRTYFEAKKPPV